MNITDNEFIDHFIVVVVFSWTVKSVTKKKGRWRWGGMWYY